MIYDFVYSTKKCVYNVYTMSNNVRTLIEEKQKAIQTILISKDLYLNNNWLAILSYIKETNDLGELEDLKSRGASVDDLITEVTKANAEGKIIPVTVLGAPILNDPELYAFLTEDFFFNNFYEPGLSVLDKKLDSLWHIYDDERTGSKNYMIGIEGIITSTGTRSALGTFGALQKKDGEWRGLPVAAFRFE